MSVMPAVVARMGVFAVPYVTVWLIPTNSFAGDVLVIGLHTTLSDRATRDEMAENLHKADIARELAGVDIAERQLAISTLDTRRGLKRDADEALVD